MRPGPDVTDATALFVAFEGPEGAGKSTQVARLADRLASTGRDTLATREPGGSLVGDRIRELLLDPRLAIEAVPEFLLYAAARAQHVHETIAPALARGAVVLCDRFAASSVAYQGHGRGLDPSWIGEVNARATSGHLPDLTILLDLPSVSGLARVAARGATDRLERADLAFHERVRRGFLAQAEADPTWTVIDAQEDEDAVARSVWAAVEPRLHGAGARRP